MAFAEGVKSTGIVSSSFIRRLLFDVRTWKVNMLDVTKYFVFVYYVHTTTSGLQSQDSFYSIGFLQF